MKWTPVKMVAFALILAFYASVLTHTITLPAADDLPRQIKIGELILHGNWDILYKNVFSYTEPSHTFYDRHWFSGVVFALMYHLVGWGGLVVFKVAAFLTAFSLVFFTALRRANFWLVAFLSIPAIVVILERTGLRPEVFSYLFVTFYLFTLVEAEEYPERNRIYWLVPLQLFWVNMHVFFSIGIMMVAGFAFQEGIRRWKTWRTDPFFQKVLRVLFGVAAVSFLNPRGVQGVFYRYPPQFPLLISENQSLAEYLRGETTWEDPSIPFFKACVVLLAFSFVLARKRRPFPVFYALAALATSVLGFVILRSLALFGFVFLAVASANLAEPAERAVAYVRREAPRFSVWAKRAGIAALMGACVLLVVPGWRPLVRYRPSGIGLTPYADGAGTFLVDQGIKGPIFGDGDIGSYLIFYLYPKQRVFADNRFGDAYSPEFFQQILDIYASEDAWNMAVAKYGFNAIVSYHYGGTPHARDFLWRRMHDPNWALVYADPFVVTFVRNTAENKDVIDRFHITPENAEQRLAPLISSPKPADWVAAADLLNLIGREVTARKLFLDVVAREPWRGRVWALFGNIALSEGTEEGNVLAMMFFQKAIQEGRGTAEVYGLLGSVYARMNQQEKAIETLQESLRIDPGRMDTNELLHSITKLQTP